MISYLQGKILSIHPHKLVLLTQGGVGYELSMQTEKLSKLVVGDMCGVHTYMRVGENLMELFGFENLEEKAFFELLISVNGVGPKSALNIMGLGSLDQIKQAIARQDVPYLTQVSGIGKKTAERMVVELKSKVGKFDVGVERSIVGDKLGDVVDALVSMGYSKEEARDVVKDIEVGEMKMEEILKMVLRTMKQ
jgi:Holliday junction DNA helicase RuvA